MMADVIKMMRMGYHEAAGILVLILDEVVVGKKLQNLDSIR